jgi:hypothetical protein
LFLQLHFLWRPFVRSVSNPCSQQARRRKSETPFHNQNTVIVSPINPKIIYLLITMNIYDEDITRQLYFWGSLNDLPTGLDILPSRLDSRCRFISIRVHNNVQLIVYKGLSIFRKRHNATTIMWEKIEEEVQSNNELTMLRYIQYIHASKWGEFSALLYSRNLYIKCIL